MAGSDGPRLGTIRRAGGVYLPPHLRKQQERAMAAELPKSSEAMQRVRWERLRRGINGLVNRANVSNMASILPQLLQLNLVRGRGLLVRALMKAQMASPGFTHIYAALAAVVNTKLPEIGELLLHRVVLLFRRAYRRSNKTVAMALSRFIAHLAN